MAIKLKITKAEYDVLSDAMKALYKAVGSDYQLDASDYEEPGELKRAKDREVEAARLARERAEKAERERDEFRDAAARKAGDITTLDKSWQKKLDDAVLVEKTRADQLNKQLQNVLVDKEAIAIAAELGGESAELLLPHITKRLQAEVDGDVAITRVLDKEGKKSALTLAELKKEISEDKRFSPIIIASRASGGGAAGGNRQPTNGGAGSGGQKKFHELTGQERTDWYKRDPEGFKKASDESTRALRDSRMRPAVSLA